MSTYRNYSCNVCNVICNSVEQLRIHEGGKSHLKKCKGECSRIAMNQPSRFQSWKMSPESDSSEEQNCPMCSKQFSPAELLTHECDADLADSISLTGPFVVFEPTGSPSRANFEKNEFFCAACSIALSSQVNYDAHVLGKKHISNERELLKKKSKKDGRETSSIELLSCSLNDIKVVEGSDDPFPSTNLFKNPGNTSFFCSRVGDTSHLCCSVCNISLNSTDQMAAHVGGKKHQSNIGHHQTSKLPMGLVDIANVYDAKGSYSLSPRASPKSTMPIQLPSNSILCSVCNVPVCLTEVSHHERGRSHLYKSAMAGCTQICKSILNVDRTYQRQFRDIIPSLLTQLPVISKLLCDKLFAISESSDNIILKMPSDDLSSVVAVGMAVALGIVYTNRNVFEHTLAAWICPRKSAIPNRVTEARQIIENFTGKKPYLANILKETFSLDDPAEELTQHDIAFSTPGNLTNIMNSHPNINRAICALVLTDIETCVDNDPTSSLLNKFLAIQSSSYPRIICITGGSAPSWPLPCTFLCLQ